MARHTISIINGSGSIELTNGTYNATAVVNGYNANTLNPKNGRLKAIKKSPHAKIRFVF